MHASFARARHKPAGKPVAANYPPLAHNQDQRFAQPACAARWEQHTGQNMRESEKKLADFASKTIHKSSIALRIDQKTGTPPPGVLLLGSLFISRGRNFSSCECDGENRTGATQTDGKATLVPNNLPGVLSNRIAPEPTERTDHDGSGPIAENHFDRHPLL